ADALASENYLRGGTEDAASRLLYEAELQAVNSGLVTLGNRVPAAQAQRLAEVSGQLGEYAGLVEQARANNRQGYPVGAAYLRTANSAAAQMTTVLREVQAALRQQVNAALDRADTAGMWLHLVGWPLLLLLAVGGGWVAFRFRRLLNVPLAAALLLTLLVVVVGGTMQGGSLADAESATAGPLQAADLASQARVAAFDAHTQESLALINRGNADESMWSAASDVVGLALAQLCGRSDQCDLQSSYDQYGRTHLQVRELDDSGDWDAARELSLGDGSEAFASFASDSSDVAQAFTSSAVSELSGSASGLGGLRAVVFIAGLVVAALAVAGFGQRLREYR
ncbi:MAG: hypothetical protein Q7V88_10755, partial [Actinomycetota bacterium]|nr:hypothetical protein [Actinomycetota bacterium]